MYRATNENHDHQTLNEQSLRNVLSVIFLLKKVLERIVTSNLVREGCVSYTDAGKKKVPECHSSVRSSEKERPELCSGMFCHKNSPKYTYPA
jgi:hypothetical protein